MSTNLAMLLGRFLVVVQLLPNGWRKIQSFESTAAMMGGAPPQMINGRMFSEQTPLFYYPFPELFLSGSIFFDIALSLLIIVGFRTRTAAGILAAYVCLAMLTYHSDIRNAQDVMAVMRNLPFLGALLILAVTGAGGWSLDARRRNSNTF